MRSLLASTTALLLFTGCASSASATSSDQPERPPTSAEMQAGYGEAVGFGSRYVAEHAYINAELQSVDSVMPNIWCVHYGLSPKGSGKTLELYFDETTKSLVKAQINEGKAHEFTSFDGR